MKRMRKRLLSLLLCICMVAGLLPVTAGAAGFPSKFYASIILSSSSNTESFGSVSSNGTYTNTGAKTDRVIYGMEYAGGVFFTVEGTRGKGSSQGGNYTLTDDGWRELRMYNSNLTSYRTIGEINAEGGGYKIVDTAIDLSGEKPVLYGTYNQAFEISGSLMAFTTICSIDLTDGHTSNYLQVKGDLPSTDIIYAIAFDKTGTLYAIGADAGADGGPATLYTIDLDNVQTGSYGSQTVQATKIADIESQTGTPISTNFAQDMAFDFDTGTLYWAENKGNDVYTLDTNSAEATYLGQVKYSNKAYPLQSFCIPNDTAFDENNKYMVSVIYTGGGKVTNKNDSNDEGKAFYMVDKNGSLTLALTPDQNGKLLSVKVDGTSVSTDSLTEYTFSNVTKNHVIEVAFRDNLPVTQKNMTWFHYQGYPASFYTQHHAYKFYELPYTTDAPKDGYTQTLLDDQGQEISNDTVILPGNYDVRVTHAGTSKYNALDVVYKEALQLGKCPGTPGRPVVYGKVGCTQGDLSTTSALQDYYGSDGELIDAAHDEIPVTLVWLNPETVYDTAGNFYANATIYAAQNLDQRLLDCYNLDDGKTPLTGGCQISSRATQVVVLPADEASLIKVQASDASGGTVSGKGVYKNGDKVTVTAAVNTDAGYEFKGWQENGQTISGAGATYTFNASGDRTLTALFEVNEDYRVTLKTDPADAGTVTGGGSYKDDPHSATVTATANPGYYFMGWYNGETQASTKNPYTFTVTESGAALTAKFGIDYLALAELAWDNLESSLGTSVFEWSTLTQAVDAYETAKTFVQSPPSGVENAQTRFEALTGYYSGVTELDFSNLGIGNEDLKELYLFTGVTELNLSGNKDVTDLSNLSTMEKLETLDLSNTVITDLSGLNAPEKLKNLNLSGNTAISNLNGLSGLTKLEMLNLSGTGITDLSGLSSLTNLETLNLSGNKNVSDLSALSSLGWLETLDISDTGVTAFDTLVKKDTGKLVTPNLKTLTAQNLALTSISALAEFVSKDEMYCYITAALWDFTGSTLPPKKEHRTDVATIEAALGNKFIPPTIPDNTYIISASPATLDFGSVYPDYTQPAAQTVTIKNTGNQTVTLDQPTSEHYILGNLSNTELEPGDTATFTVQPKPELELGNYDATLTVTGNYEDDHTAQATVSLQFKVAQQSSGGGGGGIATYAVSVPEETTGGALSVSPEKAVKGDTVTLTVKPDEGYELDTLTVTDAKGNAVATTSAGDGKYTFTMPDSKVEIKASFREISEQSANPFTDVYKRDYYYDAVQWAVDNGVTNGTSAATFSPDAPVSRAQMVTFLWRAHDAPKATGENPFTDVKAGDYYYDAVLWAAANGVTNGTSAATFSPDAPVTRAQSVTFQWRAAGSPAATGERFLDVAADAYYADAVTWAVANDITNGTSAATFSPNVVVSRAQAVTFLYRELA